MDIQKLRQEFEKLPDIKGILHGSDFGFNESLNQYYHPDHANHRLSYAFIMGAWMAWITKAQVPDGFILVPRKNIKYFSNDGENYEVHNTLAEAKHEAECAIEHFSELLADQTSDPRSDGNFSQVGYGIVLAESGYSIDHVVTQEDIDKGDYSYEVGTEIMSLFLIEAQEQSHEH